MAASGFFATVAAPSPAFAQAAGDRSDAGVDADDARTDALLGTLNLTTPQPYGNLYSTAPGAEQQAARPQFRFNFLAPLNYDSNPLGTGRRESSELGHVSGRQPLLGGPGRRPALPGFGQCPLRAQELLQRVGRRHRPAHLHWPRAICRSDQRPGLLPLFRHHAALQLSAHLLGSDRGAAGLQPRLQQELPSR